MRLYHTQEREGGEGKPHSPIAQLTDVDCVGEPGPLLVGLRESEAALRRLSGGCFSRGSALRMHAGGDWSWVRGPASEGSALPA